ncbi:M15 family metallopeptidase [Actinokineospora sp. G85]|uniref:M15 family metallopeptidase n=1 Tax=Actinokineospora sp. G85 TaxID=3406626 RepID=UPI003C77095C
MSRLLAATGLVLVLVACGPAGSGEDGSIAARGSISPHDDHPALARLDPALLAAVRRATEDASRSGIELRVTSGWRDADYQRRLLDAAIAKHGSVEEARRWVATPERSAHVTGDAVDIGPTDAADWLIRNGDEYGLCQTYANEMWHFELRTTPGGECPAPLPDAGG